VTGQYVVILTGGALPGDHPAADADPPAHQLDLAIERGTGNDGAPVLRHVAEEAWLLGYKEAAALHRPVAAWVVNGDRETAGRFAEFVSREIDPAYVTAARSPLDEMLRADGERRHPVPSDEVPF
jgi:hypothetical protein